MCHSPTRIWWGWQRLVVWVCVLMVGCGGRTDSQRFQAAVDKVRARTSDAIDARAFRHISDKDIERLSDLNGLAHLILDDTSVTDVGVQQIPFLPNLDIVSLSRTKVTDIGVEHLNGLANLQIPGA